MQIYTYNYLASRNYHPNLQWEQKGETLDNPLLSIVASGPQGKNSRCAAMLKPVSRRDAEPPCRMIWRIVSGQ